MNQSAYTGAIKVSGFSGTAPSTRVGSYKEIQRMLKDASNRLEARAVIRVKVWREK